MYSSLKVKSISSRTEMLLFWEIKEQSGTANVLCKDTLFQGLICCDAFHSLLTSEYLCVMTGKGMANLLNHSKSPSIISTTSTPVVSVAGAATTPPAVVSLAEGSNHSPVAPSLTVGGSLPISQMAQVSVS